MKKYLSLIGISALVLVIGWLGYQALFAYLSEHTYYFGMTSSSENWRVFITALLCAGIFPILYLIASSKLKIKNLIIRFIIGAGIYGVIHSNIKGTPIGFGNIITIFNTILLVSLGTYLVLGFSALGSWIQRKLIKFKQLRRQEILLSFGIGLCSFMIIIQILLGIGLLYGIVSWILFIGLGFMIRYEREELRKQGEIIGDIFNDFRIGLVSSEWNLNKKEFRNPNKLGYIGLAFLLLFSIAYLYIGIQNAFTPYSTAWDANHEYMYTPKILAENHGIFRGNTVANTMPGLWHQFLTFIFSLTGCTNGWFGISTDNIAISMNNISATLVLIFGLAIVFQIFSLINEAKKDKEKSETKSASKKGNQIISKDLSNGNGFIMGWTILLLWLTSGMGAFLVIVDNKTDLGVMALSLLALLAGLVFLQNRKSDDKKEILKYVIIAGLFFGFAALAKITAFVDIVLFGLLLIGLRFSPLTSLGLGVMVMGLVRKFDVLTSSVMLTNETATWLIIIGGIITFVGLIIHLLSKNENREKFGRNIRDLIILGIGFLIPLLVLKLPWTTISQIKTDNYSISNSLKAVFLGINTETKQENDIEFLAQNTEIEENNNEILDSDSIDSLDEQNEIDASIVDSKSNESFEQCISIGNIYSEEELNEDLQELNGGQGGEDFGRYIGYGGKEFTETNLFGIDEETLFKSIWPRSNECEGANENTICEKNLSYRLLKLFRPTSETCYGLDHDAKILCNNADVINNFKIDDIRAIYENGINNKEGEAGLLLKAAIDSYDKAKSEGKLGFLSSNTDIFHDEIVNLRQYYLSHSISSNENSISIPYRYLVPLNISFNWSLQNLSSYYTDIGFFRIIIYVFLIICLPYAIIKKDKVLTSITLTTLIGWGIRWIIGSSILRYGTVLISWSMITIALLWDRILQKEDEESPKVIPWILIIIVGLFFWIQIVFNFLRIASQGASSVFVRYKGNVGNPQIIDENLNAYDSKGYPLTKKTYGYGWKNIFNLQFPQYNPIINQLANRKNEEGVIIAGTYIQYFLGNQRNIKSDGMLIDFRKNSSDGDLCKTYRRLKNDNTRYLIIDPNIGTVTMGEGNETLFYRFFGKLSSNKSRIEIDGTITTLIRLAQNGYLKLLNTNNLGSKYAFTVDDSTIRAYFGENLTNEELILTRAKMAILQYFDDADTLFGAVVNIFITRAMNDPKLGIEDISNIYGLEVDSGKLANIANTYRNGQLTEGFAKDLTQDERSILLSYLNVYSTINNGDTSHVQDLLLNSVTGGSQIIALELN